MIDLSKIEKRFRMTHGPLTAIPIYHLGKTARGDLAWFFDRYESDGPFSLTQLKDRGWLDIPELPTRLRSNPMRIKLTKRETDQVWDQLRADEVDWRPTETIPEDYHAL